nr:FAD-dependent monooxygenase [Rhodomicrobium sp. Az07]
MAVSEIQNSRFDIVISGGSFVGLALARALEASAPGAFAIAVIEQRTLAAATADPRTVALTASAKAMLEATGIWERIADKAEPIRRIVLTDSPLESPVRPGLIGLDADDTPTGAPTAYVIENAALLPALLASLEGLPNVSFFAPDAIDHFETRDEVVSIGLRSGAALSARLLVAADGRNSAARETIGIGTQSWPSDKVGIVATVGTERPHNGTAWQHFLPAGPFAILPMTTAPDGGNRASVVWTEDAAVARGILAQDRETVLTELSRRFGPELGALTLLSNPLAFPLSMVLAREFVRPRFALVGDAAHGLNWIAGQGLNHGLKDVAALAETLVDAARLGLDIGDVTILRRYERWRRFDVVTSAFSGAALNAFFSNDWTGLRMLRNAGLRTLDGIGRLKTLFMNEAAGRTGEVPKLLRGEAL